MGRWQLACKAPRMPTNRARPDKVVVPLELPSRVVAAILFGNPPWRDNQASNMNKFLPRNYGLPGASKPKRYVYADGTVELRRSMTASGNEETDIVADIARAAKALRRDSAKEKVISLVLHGNDEMISRLYNPETDELEHALDQETLKNVTLYRSERKPLAKDLSRREQEYKSAAASGDDEKLEAANFFLNDARRLMVALDRSYGRTVAMSDLFQDAAKAMEESGVGVLELQACGVGDSEGAAFFSLAGRLEGLLLTPGHKVEIRTHPQLVETGIMKGVVHVWLGSDPRSSYAHPSSTELPRFSGDRP